MSQISRRDFEEIYRVLDIVIIERGESFYNEIIPLVLDELVKKGIAVEDQGALCIFGNLESTPLICRKSDGGFNYASTDLAALWQVRERIFELGVMALINHASIAHNPIRSGSDYIRHRCGSEQGDLLFIIFRIARGSIVELRIQFPAF